jgi:excisionase family DNA binding protein
VLGVHPRTLQRMVLRGQISGVQVGKLWRFRASAIDQWIDRKQAGSSPQKLCFPQINRPALGYP